MIRVVDIHKRYKTIRGPGEWVLKGINFDVPKGTNIGLLGANGAGKSTLLRIIAGVDFPTRGHVERHCRVSWPMGLVGGLAGSMTGRQNAKFVCRIHGLEYMMAEALERIQSFAGIGAAFDEPVKTYSSGMRSRLVFALSLAFDFDVYISDEITSVGDVGFRNRARLAFEELADRAGLIMASHSTQTLENFCHAGVVLVDGEAKTFDTIQDAIKYYNSLYT